MDARQYIINEAIQEQRQIFGAENPEKAWILTGWDTWETNPYYVGPPQPHPEYDMGEEPQQLPPPPAEIYVANDDDCPF